MEIKFNCETLETTINENISIKNEIEIVNEKNYLINKLNSLKNEKESTVVFEEHIQRFYERDLVFINEAISLLDSDYFKTNNDLWYDKTLNIANIKWYFPISQTTKLIYNSDILKIIKLKGMKQVQTLFKIVEILKKEILDLTLIDLKNYDINKRFNDILSEEV